jgi:predicted small lipoprotein YifL
MNRFVLTLLVVATLLVSLTACGPQSPPAT